MKSPPYLVYLGFAHNVNCASVKYIYNNITLKAINYSKILVLFYMECTRTFLQHSSTEIEMN